MGKLITTRTGEQKKVYLLIDADSLIFGSSVRQKEDAEDDGFIRIFEDAEHKFEEMIFNMMDDIETKFSFDIVKYILFFEGRGNFRYNIDSHYKDIRKGKERPPAIPVVKDLIRRSQPYFESINCETDDSIVSTYMRFKDKFNLVIVSPDKDIKTVPALIYNSHPAHKTLEWVSEEDAMRNKYMQYLTGDNADSIKGIKGVGEKRALQFLEGCKTEYQYLRRVFEVYRDGVPKRTKTSFKGYHDKAGQLLRQRALLLNMGLKSINIPNLDKLWAQK